MDTFTKGLVTAIVIVLVICLVAYAAKNQPGWAHLDYWKAHYAETPDQILARSAGGYDDAAALALQRSEGHPNPTAADHLRAATIIHRNVLSQEHRPRSATNAADVELSRLRETMFGRARNHYASALANLTNREVARDEAARAVRRFALPHSPDNPPEAPPRGEVEGQPGPAFIIDAALEFAFNGLATLVDNDPLLMHITFPPVDGGLVSLAEDRQLQTIRTRREAAKEVAENTNSTRAEAFLDLSQRNTSDPQNSHDPSVNAAKKAIVERLREDQGDYERLPTLGQIIDEINLDSDDFSRDPRTAQPRPALTEKAVAVVVRASNGERSSSAQATDEEVLRRVWARANDRQNSEKRDLMRQAVYDALVDSWERGIGGDKIQCVDGRISRVVGALSLLDHDQENWGMQRLEQHKNDIYKMAADVIRAAAVEAAEQSEDGEMRKVGKSYLAVTPAELREIGDVDEAKEKDWTDATLARVAEAIDAYIADINERTPGAVPGHAIDGIKREALAALG